MRVQYPTCKLVNDYHLNAVASAILVVVEAIDSVTITEA